MPASDVLEFARATNPNLKNKPDDEVLAFAISQNPNLDKQLSTSERAKMRLDATAREEGFQPGAGIKGQLANVIQTRGEEAQRQSDRQAHAEFGSTMLKGGAVAAAGLATGGMAFWPAMAVMAGTGAGASLAGTLVEESAGIHKGLKERAGEVATDALLGAAGEGIGRGVGFALKKMIPQALTQAAARSAKGAENQAVQSADLFAQLSKSVKNEARKSGQQEFWTNVSKPIKVARQALDRLPKGRGPLFRGAQIGEMSPKAQEFFEAATGHLKMARMGGQIGDLQPLDAVVLSQFKLKEIIAGGGLTDVEKGIVTRAYQGIDRIVKADLKGIPGAEAAHGELLKLAEASAKAGMGTRFAEALTQRALSGAAGAAVGGPVGGALGVAAGGQIPQMAALLLERVAENPSLARSFRRAAELFSKSPKGALNAGKVIMQKANMGEIIDFYSSLVPEGAAEAEQPR